MRKLAKTLWSMRMRERTGLPTPPPSSTRTQHTPLTRRTTSRMLASWEPHPSAFLPVHRDPSTAGRRIPDTHSPFSSWGTNCNSLHSVYTNARFRTQGNTDYTEYTVRRRQNRGRTLPCNTEGTPPSSFRGGECAGKCLHHTRCRKRATDRCMLCTSRCTVCTLSSQRLEYTPHILSGRISWYTDCENQTRNPRRTSCIHVPEGPCRISNWPYNYRN